MKELEWQMATRVYLVDAEPYPVTSVAFREGWVFAKNQNGVVAFPAWQVTKVALG